MSNKTAVAYASIGEVYVNTMTKDEFNTFIDGLGKSEVKRKEAMNLAAMEAMGFAFNHGDLDSLKNFALKLKTENDRDALRRWAHRFSPARKITLKKDVIGFTYRMQKVSEGEERQAFDWDGMRANNFLDIDNAKEERDAILKGTDSYLKRLLNIVKEIDGVIKGERSDIVINEDEIEQVKNLRDHIVKLGDVDLDEPVAA